MNPAVISSLVTTNLAILIEDFADLMELCLVYDGWVFPLIYFTFVDNFSQVDLVP